MPNVEKPLYIATVGLMITNALRGKVKCPNCGLELTAREKSSKPCWIHSSDKQIRLDHPLKEKMKEYVNALEIDETYFKQMAEEAPEIKGFDLINERFAGKLPSVQVGLISSNSYYGWMATFLIERYFQYYAKHHEDFVRVIPLGSMRNSGKAVDSNFTTEEADDIITELIRQLKERPESTPLRINMTAGDRIFYPYYLYLDNLLKYTKKMIDSEVYMINSNEVIKWIPFPAKQPTGIEVDTIKDVLGLYFVENERFKDISEKDFRKIMKERTMVSTILKDCIQERKSPEGLPTYQLNLRGKLLYEVYYHL